MPQTRQKPAQLRSLPEAELRAQIQALRQELWELRVKARDGSLQQNHLLPLARRQLARVATLLREQQQAPAPRTPSQSPS